MEKMDLISIEMVLSLCFWFNGLCFYAILNKSLKPNSKLNRTLQEKASIPLLCLNEEMESY